MTNNAGAPRELPATRHAGVSSVRALRGEFRADSRWGYTKMQNYAVVELSPNSTGVMQMGFLAFLIERRL
jgi:hypothetical protein